MRGTESKGLRSLAAAAGLCALASFGTGSASVAATQALRQSPQAPAPVSTYKIVKIYPHDRTAFTEGLLYADGVLYESTGQTGRSDIRKVRLENGEVLQRQPLESQYFGEGIVIWKKSLIQLT